MSEPVSVWTALKRAAATTNSYDYDVAGNRTQETIAGAQTTFVYNNSVNKLSSRSGAQGSATYTHDLNGSLTADGTRTFEWDGANRLVAINIGTHRSEFSYDGIGRRTRIVEKDNSVVTSYKRYLWCGGEICEERDSSGSTVQKRFFEQGVQDNGVKIHYTRDHLGSIREKTDTGNQVLARYDYDQWGRQTVLAGSKDTFGYAGYFVHQPSGLLLTWYRAYDPNLARWISRDPIGEIGGVNPYAYVENNPTNLIDLFGLQCRSDCDERDCTENEFLRCKDFCATQGKSVQRCKAPMVRTTRGRDQRRLAVIATKAQHRCRLQNVSVNLQWRSRNCGNSLIGIWNSSGSGS